LLRYLLERLLHTIAVLIVVSVAVFLLLHLVPGDPIRMMASPLARQEDIERLRARWGLDQPLPVQYFRWAGRVLQGDLGESVRMRVPVSEMLWPRYVNTVRLTLVSMVIAVSLGLLMGILAGVARNSPFDTLSMVIAIGGFSIPPFWLGLVLILVFAVKLGLFPTGGGDSSRHIVLPALSLGVATMALIARMTRSALLEVLGQDYIRTARSKGLAERRVVMGHAIKNALIPVVTVIGLQFGVLMAGAVVTEVVFTWPGIGALMVNSILNRDFPIVQATLLVTSVTFILINLVVDILYTYLDPRIRYY
jgi:ABC-type dipeptide/oligopeptide/nickel transport system permease component